MATEWRSDRRTNKPERDLTKAKIDHQCHWCGRTIFAGDEYIRQRVTAWESRSAGGDSMFWTYKAHPICQRLWYLSPTGQEAQNMNEVLDDIWIFREEVLLEPEGMCRDNDPLLYRLGRLYFARCETALT